MNKQTLGLILGLGAAPISANAQTAAESNVEANAVEIGNNSAKINSIENYQDRISVRVETAKKRVSALDLILETGDLEARNIALTGDDILRNQMKYGFGITNYRLDKLETAVMWNRIRLEGHRAMIRNLREDARDLKFYVDNNFSLITIIFSDVYKLDQRVKGLEPRVSANEVTGKLNKDHIAENAERISALESEKNAALYLGPVLGGDRTAIAAGAAYLPNSWLRLFAEGYFRTGSDIVDEKPLIEVRGFDGLQERSYHTKSTAAIPRAMAGVEGNVVVLVGDGKISLGGMIGGELDSVETCTSGYDQLTFNGEAAEEKDSYASCSDPGFDVSFVLGTQGRYIHPVSDSVNAGVVLRAQKNLESLNSGKGYRGFVLGEVQF